MVPSSAIQLSINSIKHQSFVYIVKWSNSSIWPIDMTLSDATSLGKSEPGSEANKKILRIPQNSSIVRASPLDCLVPYPGLSLGVFTRCRDAVGVFYSPSRLSNIVFAVAAECIYIYIYMYI